MIDCGMACAQLASVPSVGITPSQDYLHTAVDSVNLESGNVNLHIPIVSYPQLGGKLKMGFMLRFNAPVWQFAVGSVGVNAAVQPVYIGNWQLWNDFNQNTVLGVDLVRDQGVTQVEDYLTFICLGTSGIAPGSCLGTNSQTGPTSTTATRFSVRDRSGAVHTVGSILSLARTGYSSTFLTAPDGSGWTPHLATSGTEIGLPESYTDRDGLLYTSQALPTINGVSGLVAPVITDPDGNSITATANGWTDSVGRSIPGSWVGPGNGLNSTGYPLEEDPFPGVQTTELSSCPSGTTSARIWTIPGVGSASETYYLCFGTQQLQTAFDVKTMNGGVVNGTEGSYTVNMMTALVLPNQTSYMFQYDSYGDLTQITFPTGGSVSYTWETVPWDNFSTSNPVTRVVATRTVNSLTEPSGTWNYTWSTASGPLPGEVNVSVNVSKPDGNDEYHTMSGTSSVQYFTDNPPYTTIGTTSYPDVPGTKSIYYYNGHSPQNPNGGTGKLIRTEVTTHAGILTPFVEPMPTPPPNCTIAPYYCSPVYPYPPSTFEFWPTVPGPDLTKTITYEDGSVSEQVFTPVGAGVVSYEDPGDNVQTDPARVDICYCVQYGQYSSVATYDLGKPGTGQPGPLLNTQHFSYMWNSGISSAALYLANNLLDLPYKTVTTDGSGAWAAEVDYAYDESSYSPGGVRGDPTTVTRVNNMGASVVTHTVFNALGMPTTDIDGNGNKTFASATQCSGLFPQTVISPYQSSTTLAETRTYSYDCNTGKILSYQDPNSETTSYTYNDPLGRIKTISYPDNAGNVSVSINYNGDPTPPVVTTTTTTGEASGPRVQTTLFDGLGRVTQTQLATGSSAFPIIYTTTGYDGLGQVISQSNPYYSTSDPTYGTTQYVYDTLGRRVLQIDPDKSSETWCYDGVAYTGSGAYCSAHLGNISTGTWTDFTDELGNHWQRTSDGAGRLTEVMEPNGASQVPSMETDYVYNALSDLLSVTQWGGSNGSTGERTRSFSYDSLSRLLTSYNPETGTVCYGKWNGSSCAGGYDANGNPQYKTDARGVTTNYSYDALNRVLSVTFSNDPSATPSSCNQYDVSSLTSSHTNPNWIGRMTNQWTQSASAGACPATLPAAGYWTRRSILAYDPMGRIWNEQQCTPSNCSSGVPYAPAFTYDLAGNLTTSTNGIGPTSTAAPFLFTTSYDSAGRLQALTSNQTTNYLTGALSVFPATLFSGSTGQSLPCANSQAAAYSAFGGLMNATFGNGLTLNRAYDTRLRTNCEKDTGSTVTTATSGSATVTITGSEQSQ
jgi:YD repeat-containing protein